MELPESSAARTDPEDTGALEAVNGSGSELTNAASAIETDNKLDHRQIGDWASRYKGWAWTQIILEFGYLVIVLITCMLGLAWVGYHVGPPSPLDNQSTSLLGISIAYPRDRNFLLWMSVGLSGIVGGSCFALKWLYHSVAKGLWNRDRVLWRLIVPALSGSVAVFVSLLVASGILSLIDSKFFSGFYGAIGTGWLIGYFSDNVLASLQKLAHKWFGTVDDPKGSSGTSPGAGQRNG